MHAAPERFAAVNLAIYDLREAERRGGEPSCAAWVMTEDAIGLDARSANELRCGGSRIAWVGDELHLEIDEGRPWTGKSVRGRVVLRPSERFGPELTIDGAGRHRWYPVAPRAPVVVELDAPQLRFEGHAYHDANWGDEPLEAAFRDWDWCRFDFDDEARAAGAPEAAIIYDTRGPSGALQRHCLRIDAGVMQPWESAHWERRALEMTGWKIPRTAKLPAHSELVSRRVLENTPFYARSLVDLELTADGGDLRPLRAHGVHEQLDMRRFVATSTQLMLPFRMRRGFRRPKPEVPRLPAAAAFEAAESGRGA